MKINYDKERFANFGQNAKKTFKINSKILIMGFMMIVGMILLIINNYCWDYEVILSIGTGLFSSALCMFMYEVICEIKLFNSIICDLRELQEDIKKYYHYVNNCYEVVKPFAKSMNESNLALVKNLIAIENGKIQNSGNNVLNDIIRFKSQYADYLGDKFFSYLSNIYNDVQYNMCYISDCASWHITGFNVELIKEEKIIKYVDNMDLFINNRHLIVYKYSSEHLNKVIESYNKTVTNKMAKGNKTK